MLLLPRWMILWCWLLQHQSTQSTQPTTTTTETKTTESTRNILPDSLRVRKNLNSLNNQEIHDLVHALIAAKKPGSYKGPKISGSFNQNSQDFSSAFNAVASFHGYPGLCPNMPGDGEDEAASDCCWHKDPRFLPWHRLIMVQFEDALRADERYKNVVLPYWDWTQNFEEMPFLIQDPYITIPITNEIIENPFYHSLIPGRTEIADKYTRRNPEALIRYNKGCSNDSNMECPKADRKYQGSSILMNTTLLALEERDFSHFAAQLEIPHNIVHNHLGLIPEAGADLGKCLQKNKCYQYTMRKNAYASFDPIFIIFHTMVDYIWAVFQALQKHRGIAFESDCHPDFDKDLPPFSTKFNANNVTKSHSMGIETVNYTEAFEYEYDNLQLNGMNIPELDAYLEKQSHKDRLFAGFSLPEMNINSIKFNICFPPTNCIFSDESFVVSVKHKNENSTQSVYTSPMLIYHEVTHQLPQFGLTADQNIGFKIVATSTEAKNATFAPISIFRQKGRKEDRLTVHWSEEETDFNYAPFFEVRASQKSSIKFLLENGSMSVYQYKTKEDFEACASNRALVRQEIEIGEKQTYYFQNPHQKGCKKEHQLVINKSKQCQPSGLTRYPDGNATITWSVDMSEFLNGICMTPGSFLTFAYIESEHDVTEVETETEFDNCKIPSSVSRTEGYPAPVKFPRSKWIPRGWNHPLHCMSPIRPLCSGHEDKNLYQERL